MPHDFDGNLQRVNFIGLLPNRRKIIRQELERRVLRWRWCCSYRTRMQLHPDRLQHLMNTPHLVLKPIDRILHPLDFSMLKLQLILHVASLSLDVSCLDLQVCRVVTDLRLQTRDGIELHFLRVGIVLAVGFVRWIGRAGQYWGD